MLAFMGEFFCGDWTRGTAQISSVSVSTVQYWWDVLWKNAVLRLWQYIFLCLYCRKMGVHNFSSTYQIICTVEKECLIKQAVQYP